MAEKDKQYLTFTTKEEFLHYIQEHVLSRSEAQEFLNVSRQSFYRMVKEEKVLPFKTVGEGSRKQEFFLKEDLLPYKEALTDIVKKYHPGKDKNEH